MKLAAFNATCPFEIGDKITERREIHPTGLAFNGPVFTEVTHTITDIVCQHSVKTGEILFLYELDNSGKLVVIAAEEERRRKNDSCDLRLLRERLRQNGDASYPPAVSELCKIPHGQQAFRDRG